MAYSKFTLVSVKKQFGLVDKRIPLFPNLTLVEPSDWLKQTLEYSIDIAYFSEKSRSEAVVMPIGNKSMNNKKYLLVDIFL